MRTKFLTPRFVTRWFSRLLFGSLLNAGPVAQLLRLEARYAVVVKNLGDKRVLDGLELGQVGHRFGLEVGPVFGPHPRSYAFSLPKKVRKAALCSVLSAKLRDDKLTVLDKIEIEAPKTKLFAELLRNLGVQDQKTLFLVPEKDPDLTRASRNIYKTLVLPTEGMNVYDLLRFERLTILKDALPRLSERLS